MFLVWRKWYLKDLEMRAFLRLFGSGVRVRKKAIEAEQRTRELLNRAKGKEYIKI